MPRSVWSSVINDDAFKVEENPITKIIKTSHIEHYIKLKNHAGALKSFHMNKKLMMIIINNNKKCIWYTPIKHMVEISYYKV